MLKSLRAKWGLLVCGSSLVALQLGQCIGDLIEDIFIFNIID